MERRVVNPWTWQDQFGFVQANEVGNPQRFLICSGQTSVDADGRPAHAGDMGAQIAQALDNLDTLLREAGFGLADMVRLNFYTTDVDAFVAAFFADSGPNARLNAAGCRYASTLLGVARLALPELLVELEAMAVK